MHIPKPSTFRPHSTNTKNDAQNETKTYNRLRHIGRPGTAPTIKRSPSTANDDKSSIVDRKQKVPKAKTIRNAQRQKQRPKSSNDMKNTSDTERKDHNTDMKTQELVSNNKVVVSKLRQDRNYQPPRRRVRPHTSLDRNINVKQGI